MRTATNDSIREWLDSRIEMWRKISRTENHPERDVAEHYINAYQTMRLSFFDVTSKPALVRRDDDGLMSTSFGDEFTSLRDREIALHKTNQSNNDQA